MRNIEPLTTKTGPDDAGLNILLTDARLEEPRATAEAMPARLDSLACHISSRQLNHVEAATWSLPRREYSLARWSNVC